MAFVKRTWLARLGIGLNKFIIGNKDSQGRQALQNAPDSVTQQGDVISADNLNDLEDRIETGFNGKQDVLTFDVVPTQNSDNPVKSGGVYTSINNVATDVAGMKLTKVWENSSPSSEFPTSSTITLNKRVTEFLIEFKGKYDRNGTFFSHFRCSATSTPTYGRELTISCVFHGYLQGESTTTSNHLYRAFNYTVTSSSTTIEFLSCYKVGTTSGALNYHCIPVAIYEVGSGIYNS